METLNPEITDKETSKRNHQEKNDQKIHQIPNNPQPNISLSQLNTTIKQLSSDLNFLKTKRNSSLTHIPSYSSFLSNFYYNPCKNVKNIYNKEYYPYLNKVLENFIFGNYKNSSNKSKTSNNQMKKIGISCDEIYQINKYKIDFKHLPKFGKISENQIYSNRGNELIGRNFEKNNFKRKVNTYSNIEKQNKEALKFIEQRRKKYQNISKAEKEKMDNKRLKDYWDDLSKHEIPKFPKIYQKSKNETEALTKRIVNLIQKEIRKKVNRVQRASKEYNIRAKKLQKEKLVYWRKREKEIVDIQKKKDKIEIDKKKKEDELQEEIIRKKRMEYLLKQSDIYSLMMYKHLGAFMPQDDKEKEKEDNNNLNNANNNNLNKSLSNNPNYKEEIISGKSVLVNTKTNKILFQSIKVDIDEKKAREDVNNLILKQRQKAVEFDQNLNKIRKTLGGEEVKIQNNLFTINQNKNQKTSQINNINNSNNLQNKQQNIESKINLSSEIKSNQILNEQNEENQIDRLDKPIINNSSSQLIEVPKSFRGELKEYQLKGLRWLDNLFEQGINGILADEMGLGKTIQVISFLAHLSEDKNNWGPFLVIAPNATLYNWQQELNRFCPSLKVLPYWGALRERKTLRKFFNSSQLYIKSSSFHVCITSYQLVVCDEKVFHKVNWNYMILDEAQAIKNIASQRWNTLLSFNCRNRLLLTGTPIQNSMSELWALLHFIMPNLFDSHEQFQEWFSKDIEAHSQDKGELNQEQLKRLHKILKPFMLRRVKKDVEHEIGPKKEIEIKCVMTEKQKKLYNSIKEKLSNISDLFLTTDSKFKVTNLMNLVMQFRKVCNHPELFERNFGKVPFTFKDLVNENIGKSVFNFLNGDVYLRINNYSVINFILPKMIFDLCFGLYNRRNYIPNKLYIYNRDNFDECYYENNKSTYKDLFNFIPLLNFPTFQFKQILNTDLLINHITLIHYFSQLYIKNKYYKENSFPKQKISLFITSNLFFKNNLSQISISNLPHLSFSSILEQKNSLNNYLLIHRCYIPKAISFTPRLLSSNRQTEIYQNNFNHNLQINKILYGQNYNQYNISINKKLNSLYNKIALSQSEKFPNGLLSNLFSKIGFTQIELPSFERLISDCAKLKALDDLLKQLYKENHRVLIFCQMTHMIDILEEYMSKRKYSYFRMDGSTQIADRRDMINEFQTNDKIFAFLLSTRAGGLGVNLTGADTVIFYDNDWNPTMDAQATDRAHRIGQTKTVYVYRLVTKGTVEERILKRAKQKQNVQTTVYSGGAFKADIFKQNDIVELLYSEEDMKKMEADKRNLLLELNNNNNININNNNGNDLVVNGDFNANNNSENINFVKGKRRRGKKEKKEKSNVKDGKGNIGRKKGNYSDETSVSQSPGSSRNRRGHNIGNGLSRNIFAVRSVYGNNSKRNYNNEIKIDSDDENKIIIDDGVHPINLNEDNDDIMDEK